MNKQQGSSLIGVAIMTLVMGFLMSAGIYMLKSYDAIKIDEESHHKAKTLQEGLKNFIAVEKRYPCPARMDIAPDDPNFGLEDCSIVDVNGRDGLGVKIGTAPVRTLNVPDNMMVDGFGKRHIYAVTSSMTDPATADVRDGLGAITLIHKTTDLVESATKEEGFVTYALLSPGKDDRGAYDKQGRKILPCDVTSTAGENCDMDDGTFFTTLKSSVGNSNDFTHNFSYKASTKAYNWHYDTWSTCGQKEDGNEWNGTKHPRPSCFSSYQARNVECRDKQGIKEDDSKCSHTIKPESERVCSLGPCRWKTIPASC